MTIILLSGSENAIGFVGNRLTENSVVILLLIALVASQVITFMRMHEQDRVIDELIDGQTGLFEIIRLQTQLEELRIQSIERLPPYQTGIES